MKSLIKSLSVGLTAVAFSCVAIAAPGVYKKHSEPKIEIYGPLATTEVNAYPRIETAKVYPGVYGPISDRYYMS